jgi:phage shock protein A
MTLINRFARLFRADVHAVLDCIEEPALLLRQALRDMEESLAREQRGSERLQSERGQWLIRQTECEQALADCDRELDLCLAAGKDDLARAVLKRKLETEQRGKALAGKLQANEAALTAATARIEDWKAQLAGIRQKAELFTDDETRCAAPVVECRFASAIRDEDIEIALLREKERRRPS